MSLLRHTKATGVALVDLQRVTKGSTLYVNATEMAKPFGESKRPANWLKSSPSKDYMEEVVKATGVALADLQRVTKGGLNQGTWLQKDVAMEFARLHLISRIFILH